MNPKDILYIHKFEYADGGTPSDKLLLVIGIDKGHALAICAFTTSQQVIPSDGYKHGCTKNDSISYYLFEAGRVIGVDDDGVDFAFHLDTILTVQQNVRLHSLSDFDRYDQKRMRKMATLNDMEFARILKCVRNSIHLKLRIKKVLDQIFPT